MKLSIILPLTDTRGVGFLAIESALRQDLERPKYELILAIPEGARHELVARDDFRRLMAYSDGSVWVPAERDDPRAEIPLLRAAYTKVTGDVVFFMEGHTVLTGHCASAIWHHFDQYAESWVAWAPRLNHYQTCLGALITRHNGTHEARALSRGRFTFGANCAIRKAYFDALGGFDESLFRFNETAIYDKISAQGKRIDRIPFHLAVHFNDMTVPELVRIASTIGRGKYRYYSALASRKVDLKKHVPHAVYLYLRQKCLASAFRGGLRMTGHALLHLSERLYPLESRLAYKIFVWGLGAADLSGFAEEASAVGAFRRRPGEVGSGGV
jgi:hypothetical protein